MEEKIMTLHPEGKNGVNILKRRYDLIRDTLLNILAQTGEIEFRELSNMVIAALAGKFDGKILWYIVTVKQDLEARGLVEKVAKSSPQRIRLKN
ncbi:MAG: hypothetical protein DWQ05_20420 [Calditrichaeota bacterium]|nr:MAG: hypothetical protein DWQ05_20420 [Calditrichota bacterium]